MLGISQQDLCPANEDSKCNGYKSLLAPLILSSSIYDSPSNNDKTMLKAELERGHLTLDSVLQEELNDFLRKNFSNFCVSFLQSRFSTLKKIPLLRHL